MNVFNSLYYYIIDPQPDIKVDDHCDYSVISNTNVDANVSTEIEVFIIDDDENKDTNICRELTPDTINTIDICNSPENLETQINANNTFEHKTVEEIIEYYENKMKIEKLAISEIIKDVKLVEYRCNTIIMLIIFHIFFSKFW